MKELKIVVPRLCKKCKKCYLKTNNKQEICLPSSAWDKVPEGCRLEGWIFKKREEIKKNIRLQKEILLDLDIALKTADFEEKAIISEKIKRIKNLIEKYAKYDSYNW